MATLDMGNITDDKTEELLTLVRAIASYQLYGSEMECDGDDAMEALNYCIETARKLLA